MELVPEAFQAPAREYGSQKRPAVSANAAHTAHTYCTVGEATLMQSKGPQAPLGRGNLTYPGIWAGRLPWGRDALTLTYIRYATPFSLPFSPTGFSSCATACEG